VGRMCAMVAVYCNASIMDLVVMTFVVIWISFVLSSLTVTSDEVDTDHVTAAASILSKNSCTRSLHLNYDIVLS
jgi:uncharacterized membrane protein